MKKSKIIIPALACLAFSTMAAVTGTVAWFTSASAVTVKTSEFQVTGLDGSLKCTLAGGIGTKVHTDSTSGDESIVPSTNDKTGDELVTANLTHGSFDHVNKKMYTKSQEGDGYSLCGTSGDPTSSTAKPVDFQEDASKLKYNCFTWTMTFKFGDTDAKGPTDKDRNFYFDVDSTASKIALDNDNKLVSGSANAGRAFRIAFISDDTNAKPVVWSPECGTVYSVNSTAASTEKTAQSYVNSTTTTKAYTTTATGDLIFKNDKSVTKITANTAGETARKDYLGTFSSTNGWIVITCVAWFEGQDTLNVTNSATKPTVSVDMGFYVRTKKAS